jgi:uncharacterized protein YecE (DUF72 family)
VTNAGKIRIGISGWRYKGWRGGFYPQGLAQRRELEYASNLLNTIELNGTFYSLQRPDNFAAWRDGTPDNFVFSVKGSRFLTHMRKLKDAEIPLANFFAQGVLRLGKKLGPILWQFPPNFKFNPDRLQSFFHLLPRTHQQAADLAKLHDARLDGRDWHKAEPGLKSRKLRYAIEIRNDSFVCEEFISLLRKHEIALVQADTVDWPLLMDVTADFVYCRLHGSEQLYTSGYDDIALDQWADRVTTWASGGEVANGRHASLKVARKRPARDVFVYFDNDAKVRAPFDAQSLQRRILEVAAKSTAAA